MALRARVNAVISSPKPEAAPTLRKSVTTPSRIDKSQISIFVDKTTKRQLDLLTLDEETTLQQLMLESINLLFKSRGLTRTASHG